MKFAKFLAGLLILVLITVFSLYIFNKKEQETTATQITQKMKTVRDKSADDPTYAQELRALTAKVKTTENQMQADAEARDRRARELKTDLETLSSQVRQLSNNGQLNEIKTLVEKVSEQNGKVESENNTLREQVKTIAEKLTLLQQQQAEKDQKISALSEQLAKAQEAPKTSTTTKTPNKLTTDDVKEIFGVTAQPVQTTAQATPSAPTRPVAVRKAPITEPVAETPKKASHDYQPYQVNLGSNAKGDKTGDNEYGLAAANLSKLLGDVNEQIDDKVLPMKELGYKSNDMDGNFKPLTRFPVYTLPPTTMLTDSTLLTPLIGRVPVGGNVNDPFRFQLEIGAENLAANGHHIPGIKKAIASGYATGIREQSCVRASISTMTFIFEDGRIATTEGNSKDAGDGLGYLTDPQGTPCILGEYINNAESYLKDRSMASFLSGLAMAYGQSNIKYSEQNGTLKGYVSGNAYQFAAAQGIANTAEEIAQYVRERARDAFDVVYVPQASRVQIILQEQIEIDYDLKNRKINYLMKNQGVTYD